MTGFYLLRTVPRDCCPAKDASRLTAIYRSRDGNSDTSRSAELRAARSAKLLASIEARHGVSDAIPRRILGHALKRGDVLYRHYVSLDARNVAGPLEEIRSTLLAHAS